MSISDKWVWITIFSVTLVIVVPLIVVLWILTMSPELRLIATLGIIVLWAIVAGYKDWVISKRQEAEKPSVQGLIISAFILS
jgi:hypothetical protein